MRKSMALLLVAAMLSGCTGSFVLTKGVYNFHRGFENRWADEIAFIVVAYLPVYALAILGDAIIFNTIEFWTDKNPLSQARAEGATRVAEKGDMKTIMTCDAQGAVKVDSYKAGALDSSFVLAREGNSVVLKDANGKVVYYSTKDAEGGITLTNAEGKVIKHMTAAEVQAVKDKKS